MSDKVKLIIEIPKTMYENVQNGTYCGTLCKELKNGTPLDDVKAEIKALPKIYPFVHHIDIYVKEDEVLQILDNMGEGDKEC